MFCRRVITTTRSPLESSSIFRHNLRYASSTAKPNAKPVARPVVKPYVKLPPKVPPAISKTSANSTSLASGAPLNTESPPTPETPAQDPVDDIPFLRHFTVYNVLRFASWFTAGCLGLHIFWEYGYALSPAWGISMVPLILAEGDFLLISKYYRRGREVHVGDVISFKHPVRAEEKMVKRVLGMPGDFVLRDSPMGSGSMIQVPTGHCWVVGDNLTESRDSRLFGPVPLALVLGKVLGRCRVSYPLEVEFIGNGLQAPSSDEDDEDEG